MAQALFDELKIGLASSDQIRAWSYGEVKKPETINRITSYNVCYTKLLRELDVLDPALTAGMWRGELAHLVDYQAAVGQLFNFGPGQQHRIRGNSYNFV